MGDATAFGGDTPYAVMFGPDVCGTSNKKTHVILHDHKKDENLLVKKEVSTETDDLTHLYTLLIKPDNTFQVFIDNKSVREGSLDEHFDFLVAKTIKDPDAKKPDDWVDNAKVVDPEDKKPDDWDEQPEEIADPDAKKPDYKGKWEHPMIDNPEYSYNEEMYKVCKDGCTHVGFEIWQVKTGTLFDDIIVTDSLEEAEEYAKETFFKMKDG